DVIYRLSIPFPLAALGGEVEVPTLNGTKRIQIPPGTQPGEIFRLKGEGIPRLGKRGRGDMLIEVTIEVPRKLSKRQRELLEELAACEEDAQKEGFFKKFRKR
ncbi:MAG: molecular chaperone DnaJ, partial [Deltaproteobacteria bacterium]